VDRRFAVVAIAFEFGGASPSSSNMSQPIPRRDVLTLLREDSGAFEVPPVHPGTILREEHLEPLEVTAYALAKAIGVPQTRLGEVLHGRRAITADTALRLGAFFGTTVEYWVGLQAHYDLATAAAEARAGLAEIEHTSRSARSAVPGPTGSGSQPGGTS
jgi:addiction module HigA family antidote